MGALAIDNKRYARVLAKVLPRVITTAEEHERMLGEVEKLMDGGEDRTAEEDAALDLMVRLIKDYEEEHDPLPDPGPHEMLVYLMEQRSRPPVHPLDECILKENPKPLCSCGAWLLRLQLHQDSPNAAHDARHGCGRYISAMGSGGPGRRVGSVGTEGGKSGIRQM